MALDFKALTEQYSGEDGDYNFGNVGEIPSSADITPRLMEIAQKLQAMPMLQQVVLEFIDDKLANLEDLKGQLFFGTERWNQMKADLIEAEGSEP